MKHAFTLLLAALSIAASVQAGEHAHKAATTSHAVARFHYVHLNVVDPAKTFAFYEKFFGASKLPYGGTDALFTERSFLLASPVATAPASSEGTSIWHTGWSGVDGASEFKWRVEDGIQVHTPLTRAILPGIDNKAEYMYFRGPDGELVELSTVNRNHRFEHIHPLASDVTATTNWFQKNLGLAPDKESAFDFFGVVMNSVHVDNVHIVIFGRPVPDNDNQFASKDLWPAGGFKPTDGTVAVSG